MCIAHPSPVHLPPTCHPSPCDGFSPSPTTTMAPCPWGSRPGGHPAFRWCCTCERDVGAPRIPLNEVVLHRPSREGYTPQKPHGALVMAPPPRRGSGECAVPPLEIGVWAIQLSPYRTGLAGRHGTRLPVPLAFPTCSCPLGLSPSGQSMTQESPFELLLTQSRIQHRVPRRTLSAYTALHPWKMF